MTYTEVCHKYDEFEGARFVQSAWGSLVPLHAGATLNLWLPTRGTFRVVEKHNEINIFWTEE